MPEADESRAFWAEAEAAANVETPEERSERKWLEAETDAWMNRLR